MTEYDLLNNINENNPLKLNVYFKDGKIDNMQIKGENNKSIVELPC